MHPSYWSLRPQRVTPGVTAQTRHTFSPLFVDRAVKAVEPGLDLTAAMPWERTASTAASAAQSLAILQFAWLMLYHAGQCVMYAQMQFQVYLSRIDSNENPLVHQGIQELPLHHRGQNRE